MSTVNNTLTHASNRPLGSVPKGRNSRSILRLRIPVSLAGSSNSGEAFSETTNTELISPCGAVVDSVQSLLSGQRVVVEFAKKKIHARVIGQAGISERGHSYGVVFEKNDPFFWGVSFPRQIHGHELMLECCRCRQSLSTRLNEIEAIVLRTNARLQLSCPTCKVEQPWKLADHSVLLEGLETTDPSLPDSRDADVEANLGLVPIASIVDTELFRPARQERRRHKRLPLSKAKACIEKPGDEPEIADVVDVSRTGACLRTTKIYPVGCWIRVSCPYMIGGSNIFQSARVVRVKEVSGLHEYGIEYVRLT